MNRSPTRTQLRRRRTLHQIIVAACLLTIGFSIGIIAALKAVGFS